MSPEVERAKLAKEEQARRAELRREAAQWERGFTACALLLSGRYEDYARERDEWLKLKAG